MRRVAIVLLAGLLALVIYVVVARATVKAVDGIQCDPFEQATYHVHAHLTIVDRGKTYEPPAGIGIHLEHLCLYWLHTHDVTGIIHIEAPHAIAPTLGSFFDIWGQPLSRQRVWNFPVGSGQSMRVYVNQKPYFGNPRDIKLHIHTAVTIEVGPPFLAPRRPNFDGL